MATKALRKRSSESQSTATQTIEQPGAGGPLAGQSGADDLWPADWRLRPRGGAAAQIFPPLSRSARPLRPIVSIRCNHLAIAECRLARALHRRRRRSWRPGVRLPGAARCAHRRRSAIRRPPLALSAASRLSELCGWLQRRATKQNVSQSAIQPASRSVGAAKMEMLSARG